MRRRAFIAALGGAVAWPLVARAQPMPRIGVLLVAAAAKIAFGRAEPDNICSG